MIRPAPSARIAPASRIAPTSRIAYVNGRYLPLRDARVSIDDRGYQFADGIYEVCALVDGLLVDAGRHLDRLERSAAALGIVLPMARRPLLLVMRELVRRNAVQHGLLYLQISRGTAPREHAFPATLQAALVMTVRAQARAAGEARAAAGVRVITLADQRWARCDIKSTALLPNVLAKQAAREAGAYEAWLVDRDGAVTEGSSSNAWIVDAAGTLVTRERSPAILGGVTRETLLALALQAGWAVAERRFTVPEALAAREAFLTSATAFVLPVVAIDGVKIADGRPGTLTQRLAQLYRDNLPQERAAGVR